MNTDHPEKEIRLSLSMKVLLGFALALVLLCGLIFLLGYENAYNDNAGGGWLPPSYGVIFAYLWLAVIAAVIALCLKLLLRGRIRLWPMLAASFLVPLICYNLNYYALQKDGPLYFLVDEGGIFHFIVIGDYNFDGMNDERHHVLYDERTCASRYGGHFDDIRIDYIDTEADGIGAGLGGTFCFYDWEKQEIDLHLNKTGVSFKEIRIVIAFKEKRFADTAAFFLDGRELTVARVSDLAVTLTFDAVTCAAWQAEAEHEYPEILISYDFSG